MITELFATLDITHFLHVRRMCSIFFLLTLFLAAVKSSLVTKISFNSSDDS